MENLQAELREYLESDEVLLWTGKPKKGLIFRLSDLYLIPFSIFFFGFSIVWINGVTSMGSWIFGIFGVPFAIIGLILVFGRFLIDANYRANTVYGLTENRLIVKSGIFSKSIKSLNIRRLNVIELVENKDGTGNISIGAKDTYLDMGSGMDWASGDRANVKIEIERIENARKVYGHIIQIQNQ